MNLYGQDLSVMDFAYSDYPHIFNSLSSPSEQYPYQPNSTTFTNNNNHHQSPPKSRHDGMSPLPLGMDWSPPPLNWNGRDSRWPHDHNTGWSYCVTIPSWVISAKSKGSDTVVFYRIQIGIQSPEGITTTREILRRFSDFLELISDLKKTFPKKNLPPPPPKKIMSMTSSSTALEERRCSLEGWMDKLLSNIDISRSAPVAIFLELEAAARSSILEIDEQTDAISDINVAPDKSLQSNSDVVPEPSATALNHGYDSACQNSEIATISDDKSCIMTYSSERKLTHQNEDAVMHGTTSTGFFEESYKSHIKGDNELIDNTSVAENDKDGHIKALLPETTASDVSSVQGHLQTLLPVDEQQKLNRLLVTAQNRLITAKADMEDIIARLNQEATVKQYASTKAKDVEVDLKLTIQSFEENMKHANLVDGESLTHMQWDMEELRKKCLEQEKQLKSVQEEKMRAESERSSTTHQNKLLLKELDAAREQLQKLQKQLQEEKIKSKADTKLLAKEVKSLRSFQLQLKKELSELVKEKLQVESRLEDERHRMEIANTANAKLLHECEILNARLRECSIDFLIDNKERLSLDTLAPNALDLLKTSDDHIGLILAEVQLLAQDMENVTTADNLNNSDKRTDSMLRKMLTDIFIDNARVRREINAVICYTLEMNMGNGNSDGMEEIPLRRTVLNKLIER